MTQLEGFDEATNGVRLNDIFFMWNSVSGDPFVTHLQVTYPPNQLQQEMCIYDATLDETMDNFTKVYRTDSKKTSFDPAEMPYLYDSKITYYCGIGRAFQKTNTVTEDKQEFTCGWDGQWFPSANLLPCTCKHLTVLREFSFAFYCTVGTHCLEPVVPPNETGLVVKEWDNQLIEINQEITYICDRKMKFSDSFEKADVRATCQDNNEFLTPEWGLCVPSE